jgi:hypothetical protein
VSSKQQQQASVMEMAKLGGRLWRWSGCTVRNLKSAPIHALISHARERESQPRASAANLIIASRFTIKDKNRFCLDWPLCRESDDSAVA